MQEEHIDRVLELYKNRKPVEKEAYLASYDDIVSNDFNLNIPRYVDTMEEEPEIDMKDLTRRIRETDKAIKEENASLLNMLRDLECGTEDAKDAISEFIRILEEA